MLREKLKILEKTVIELTKKVEGDEIKQLEKVAKGLSWKVLRLEGKHRNSGGLHEDDKGILSLPPYVSLEGQPVYGHHNGAILSSLDMQTQGEMDKLGKLGANSVTI